MFSLVGVNTDQCTNNDARIGKSLLSSAILRCVTLVVCSHYSIFYNVQGIFFSEKVYSCTCLWGIVTYTIKSIDIKLIIIINCSVDTLIMLFTACTLNTINP